jgi:hypothetical protein
LAIAFMVIASRSPRKRRCAFFRAAARLERPVTAHHVGDAGEACARSTTPGIGSWSVSSS